MYTQQATKSLCNVWSKKIFFFLKISIDMQRIAWVMTFFQLEKNLDPSTSGADHLVKVQPTRVNSSHPRLYTYIYTRFRCTRIVRYWNYSKTDGTQRRVRKSGGGTIMNTGFLIIQYNATTRRRIPRTHTRTSPHAHIQYTV